MVRPPEVLDVEEHDAFEEPDHQIWNDTAGPNHREIPPGTEPVT
jgi:hypothetical protein